MNYNEEKLSSWKVVYDGVSIVLQCCNLTN